MSVKEHLRKTLTLIQNVWIKTKSKVRTQSGQQKRASKKALN